MFKDNLTRLVAETEGGVAGLLMGFDGITVESYTAPEGGVDIQTVGMEFSFILTQVRKAAEILEVVDHAHPRRVARVLRRARHSPRRQLRQGPLSVALGRAEAAGGNRVAEPWPRT